MLNKKVNAIKFICLWISFFVILVVFIRGIGTFDFEKSACNISDYIIETNAVNEIQQGRIYEPQNEQAYIIFDFSGLSQNGVYGIELGFNQKTKINKFMLYYGNSKEFFGEDTAQKFVKTKDNYISTMYTKKYPYIKMCFNKLMDIKEFKTINKINSVIIYIIAAFIASVLCVCGHVVNRLILNKKEKNKFVIIENLKHFMKRKQIMTIFLIMSEFAIICAIEIICYLLISGVKIVPQRIMILSFFVVVVTIVIRYKYFVIRYFSVFYFFFVLILGTINIVSPPYTLDLSWDDQIHYSRANYISRGFKSYDTEAGYQLSVNSIEMGSLRKDNFTSERRQELIDFIKSIDNDAQYDGLRHITEYGLGSGGISYVPTAIGLIMGRGLGLPTIIVLFLGKWVNLLCYSLIFSYSIYLLKNRGYMIASFIGLIPTSVFLASSYSYDWWVTSLVVLGYAIFCNELETKKEINIKTMLKVMLVFLCALLPKPVYFPIVLPILAMGIKHKKGNRKGLLIGGTIVLVLILSFIIPSLRGNGLNDTRGSMEVNSAEQIKYILSNPISYGIILLKFIWGFINPDNAQETFGFLTAYGDGAYYSIVLILLVVVAIVDNISWNNSKNGIINKLRICSGIGIFGALVLISTAFYVAYTAVMSNDIDGVQCRYFIPLIFPLIYFICRLNIDIPKKIKDNVLIVGCMLMAAVLCYNIYFGCLVYY